MTVSSAWSASSMPKSILASSLLGAGLSNALTSFWAWIKALFAIFGLSGDSHSSFELGTGFQFGVILFKLKFL